MREIRSGVECSHGFGIAQNGEEPPSMRGVAATLKREMGCQDNDEISSSAVSRTLRTAATIQNPVRMFVATNRAKGEKNPNPARDILAPRIMTVHLPVMLPVNRASYSETENNP